ncbi:MAG: Rrf2 family transcriptional regulator [Anaeromyxobacteraceae bacterium]
MFLSTTTVHALRALSVLAARGEAVQGRELARALKMPPDYLAKVLGRLARAGIVKATRGAGGGYRLARPPERIALGEVVRPLEGARARPGCLLRPGAVCRGRGACAAHPAWTGVKQAYEAFLDDTTVADVRHDR